MRLSSGLKGGILRSSGPRGGGGRRSESGPGDPGKSSSLGPVGGRRPRDPGRSIPGGGGPFNIPGGGIPLDGTGLISPPGGPCISRRSRSVNFWRNTEASCLDSFSSLSAALAASQFSWAFFSFAAICERKSLSADKISRFRSSTCAFDPSNSSCIIFVLVSEFSSLLIFIFFSASCSPNSLCSSSSFCWK